MKVLVTGGAGFLGSHLCDLLLKQGHHVLCMDNLSTGSINNIKQNLDNERFEFINTTVENECYKSVDRIYNLACPASPIAYQEDPIYTLQTCLHGMDNMLKLAHNSDARIFQASTSEVYGDPLVHPQAEHYWGNVNPYGPRSCYDEGKRAAESLCYAYREKLKVQVRIGRIFNTYGPRMASDDGRVVSNFIMQALTNEPITIYGDGSQTRSLCYVDELVEAIIYLMEDDWVDYPINLGNPNEVSVLELARLVIKLTDSQSEIVHLPMPKDDPRQRQPDIRTIKNISGWEPIVKLEDGLRLTIEDFKRRYFEPMGAENE